MKTTKTIVSEILKPKMLASVLLCFPLICLPLTTAISIQRPTTSLVQNNSNPNGASKISALSIKENLTTENKFDSNLLPNEPIYNSENSISENARKSKIIKKRSSHNENLPSSCERDTEQYCPYMSRNPTNPDFSGKKALAPHHQWVNGTGHSKICCSCRYCLNPEDRTRRLSTYKVRPVIVRSDVVGCYCTKI